MTEADTHVAHPESRISAPDKSYTARLGPDALWWLQWFVWLVFVCVKQSGWKQCCSKSYLWTVHPLSAVGPLYLCPTLALQMKRTDQYKLLQVKNKRRLIHHTKEAAGSVSWALGSKRWRTLFAISHITSDIIYHRTPVSPLLIVPTLKLHRFCYYYHYLISSKLLSCILYRPVKISKVNISMKTSSSTK